jgi:hypothetical protein
MSTLEPTPNNNSSKVKPNNSSNSNIEKKSNSSSDNNENNTAALLLKIAQLEKQNQELLQERDTFKNSIVINAADVYANLQQLQANFAEKASKGYEAVRSAVPVNVPGSGHYGFDLKP